MAGSLRKPKLPRQENVDRLTQGKLARDIDHWRPVAWPLAVVQPGISYNVPEQLKDLQLFEPDEDGDVELLEVLCCN